MTANEATAIDLTQLRKKAFIVGGIGLVLTLIGLLFSRDQFFRSYLWAFLFWLSLSIGFLPLLMLYHLVGGGWGFAIRRVMETGTRTIPLMAIMFVPLFFGIHNLYEWSHGDKVAIDEILKQKEAYLNVPFWIVRTVIYFAVWVFYSVRLNRLSRAQDDTGDPYIVKRFQKVSGPGIAIYGITVTFAVFDWAMSLEPHWYSTIYGMMWMVSQVLTALAFAIVVISVLSPRPPMLRLSRADNLHDLGNLMLAFVMLWAYLSFSQFLIIWSGNLPEEIHWYMNRIENGWQWVAGALLLFHFFVPFFLLLSRMRKRKARSLTIVAVLILVMRVVDTFWVVTPAFYGSRLTFHWLDLFALAGIGGIWLGTYAGQLSAMPLVPLHDPNAAPHKAI